MKYDRKRLLFSLGIGLVLTVPIVCMYLWGEGSEDTLINAAASLLVAPVMVLCMPLLLLASIVPNPDKYVLGPFFYSVPFVSVVLYSFCTYVVLSIIAKKK